MNSILDRQEIGFIGLGQMGAAIAERLQERSARMHVYDLRLEAAESFFQRGAVRHSSARSVADKAEIVFACLPSIEASKAAADSVSQGSCCKTYVEMSTIGKTALESMASNLLKSGVHLIDAPVSGGPKGAREGTLTIICAGSPEAMKSVKPWLAIAGSNIFVVGTKPGLAQMMKLVNNLISSANMASSFEALVLGTKAGLNPVMMLEVINSSTGRNSSTVSKLPLAILPGTFDYGSRLAMTYKDIKLGLDEADNLGVPMWVGKSVGELWRFAMTQGGQDSDLTTLIRYLEGWAGIEVRTWSNAAKPS